MDQLIKYMIDVAMGMHYIMERGLVHRVSYEVQLLKPCNQPFNIIYLPVLLVGFSCSKCDGG